MSVFYEKHRLSNVWKMIFSVESFWKLVGTRVYQGDGSEFDSGMGGLMGREGLRRGRIEFFKERELGIR